MSTLKFADVEMVESTQLPSVTVDRMLQTAFNHIMGNEVAAQVVGRIRSALDMSKTEGESDEAFALRQRQAIREWRDDEANSKQIDAWSDEFRKAKLKSMLDGTLSVRAGGGVTRDPVAVAKRAIAKMEITEVLKNAKGGGAKFPGKDATVTISGQVLTGDELIERRLAHPEHGPRIQKEAERKVAADKRLAENAAKQAGSGEDLAADLGL